VFCRCVENEVLRGIDNVDEGKVHLIPEMDIFNAVNMDIKLPSRGEFERRLIVLTAKVCPDSPVSCQFPGPAVPASTHSSVPQRIPKKESRHTADRQLLPAPTSGCRDLCY
jgi:hypothetical protein